MNKISEQEKPQKLSSEVVHQNKWFKIVKDKLKRVDGQISNYYILKRPQPFVAIVAVDQQDQVIFIEQYRPTIDDFLWELPMGAVEEGERSLQAAKREFLEETGMEADNWQQIGEFYVGPGHTSQKGIVFLAQGAVKSDQKLETDDGEQIVDLQRIPLKSLEKMLKNGKIKDGPSIAAFSITKKHLNED